MFNCQIINKTVSLSRMFRVVSLPGPRQAGNVVYNGDQIRETESYKLIPYRQLSKFIYPTPA